MLDSAKEIAKAEKAYAIYPDVEVDKGTDALQNLKALGFKHKGFKEGLSKDYIQPRMTMITPIDKNDDELLNSFRMLKSFKSALGFKARYDSRTI